MSKSKFYAATSLYGPKSVRMSTIEENARVDRLTVEKMQHRLGMSNSRLGKIIGKIGFFNKVTNSMMSPDENVPQKMKVLRDTVKSFG